MIRHDLSTENWTRELEASIHPQQALSFAPKFYQSRYKDDRGKIRPPSTLQKTCSGSS